VDGILGYTPIGCGSPTLTGPTAPTLGTAACYAIFSTDGAVSNTGITTITGDVGSNNGSATGYDTSLVTGKIHPIPDVSTAQCAADLLVAYNYVNALSYDIELMYPVLLGNSLVLTPHTYLMDAAAHLTDTLFLNAQGNANAVFVIQINGALTSSTYSQIVLTNNAQAKNVYWKIEGAVSINNYSVFCGTIICNNGALGALNTGVTLNGRSLTTTGAITTTAITAIASPIPGSCGTVGISNLDETNEAITIYPNPFSTSATIVLNDFSKSNTTKLRMYNVLGKEMMNVIITKSTTTFNTSNLTAGVYFYQVVGNNITLQSGKLIKQ
ncbi:MAG: hypothetical protein A3K10_00195, partial [Bacteroidetes bacterium RIFCSPLOWO2_12_FULL_31_6]